MNKIKLDMFDVLLIFAFIVALLNIVVPGIDEAVIAVILVVKKILRVTIGEEVMSL